MNYGNDEEEDIDEDSDSSVGSYEEGSYIVTQRVHLNKHETNRLVELLPIKANVGLPFMTRFTTTNLNRHGMVYVCPSFLSYNSKRTATLLCIYMTLAKCPCIATVYYILFYVTNVSLIHRKSHVKI